MRHADMLCSYADLATILNTCISLHYSILAAASSSVTVCLSKLLTMSLSLDFHDAYVRYSSHAILAACAISSQTVKGQHHMGRSKFFVVSTPWRHAYLMDSGLAQIPPRWRCVAQHFNVKRSVDLFPPSTLFVPV